MKGHLAQQYPSPDGHYSDLKVLRSAAGYYIGTEFIHTAGPHTGLIEPGSRESADYYPTLAAAQHALDTNTWIQRLRP